MRIVHKTKIVGGSHHGQIEIYEPYRHASGMCKGRFKVAIKKTSDSINKNGNAECVDTLEEVAERVRQGYAVRMRGNIRGYGSLIQAADIQVIDD